MIRTNKHSMPTGTAAAPLMQWLALLSGLAVLTVQRVDTPSKIAPIWVGGVLGTAFGQLLAARRWRLWLVIVTLANAIFFGALLSAPLWLPSGRVGGDELELAILSFAPAAICGYLALGERVAIAGLWFPAVPWTLTVLDRANGTLADRWVLLGGPALLVIGSLYAHETRRVALWRSVTTVAALAESGAGSVRLEPTTAKIARGAWALAVGALTLALTAWIAPRLWQHEKTSKAPSTGMREADDLECCPEIEAVPAVRVREYFSPLTAQARPSNPFPQECAVCDATPGSSEHAGGTPKGATDPHGGSGVDDTKKDDKRGNAAGAASGAPSAAPAAPSAAPQDPAVVPTASGTSVAAAPPAPRHAPSGRLPARPGAARTTGAHRARAGTGHFDGTIIVADESALAEEEGSSKPWLLALLAGGILAHLGLRPLRRALALRHLREPLWPEPIDQRVSNLWQLALVGLRDAGIRVVPSEAPQAIARRSGMEDMTTCATVLERARHGVRLDAGDVDTMNRAARSVYRASRAAAGWPARAISWMRWPLA